jgi:stalled ribosome alternative rescue factor ArfA
MPKPIKKKNLMALLLSSPLFRLRKLPNKKKYNRKKQSKIRG